MRNHYYDENGIYTISAIANAGTIPPDGALRTPPPEREGFWPVLNAAGDGWELVEDHRGEEGWRNGVPSRIEEIGPLSEDWSAEPPKPPAVTDPGELRRMAFSVEADPFRDAALSYRLEAEALRQSGDTAAAERVEEKCRRELARYSEKKSEIRSRYPKDTDTPPTPLDAVPDVDDILVYLTRSGVYHREGCGYTNAAGEWTRLSAVEADHPGAKPCGRCKPATKATSEA